MFIPLILSSVPIREHLLILISYIGSQRDQLKDLMLTPLLAVNVLTHLVREHQHRRPQVTPSQL
jgi:hypothetical protein